MSHRCCKRSNSNHRCCYDFRFRDEETQEITESSISHTSSPSQPSSRRRRYDSQSRNHSGHMRHYPESNRKRHRPSSPALSPRKSRRSGAASRNGRDDRLSDANSPTSGVRFHNGGPQSYDHVDVSPPHNHDRTLSRRPHHRHGSPSRKRRHGESSHRHHHHSASRSSHKRKRQRRSKERAKRKESHEHHKRDKDSTVVPVGEVIKQRFEVRKVLGEGSFGQVLECMDLHSRAAVAVKALKWLEDYREAAKHEVDVLNALSRADGSSRSHCIETVDFFEWHKKYYIVFPLLSVSVFNLLEQNDYEPYPIEYVISISYQLCKAVEFIHSQKMFHTDLKPENIMFVSPEITEVCTGKHGKTVRLVRDPQIKIIDFGSAVIEGERRPRTIQTRHYRAPEVILELGWSYPADVWSVGCIVYELVTGQCLFMTHDNLEHLVMMERFLGPLPRRMVRETPKRRYFRRGRLDWDEDSQDGRFVRRNVKPLGDCWFAAPKLGERLAFDLVREMLVYEPDNRIGPTEALEHPLFSRT